MPFPFKFFLFIFLSPLSSLYSFFFSLLSHSSSDILINPSLFSSHCCGFSLFCSASPISVAMGFFFFFGSDLMGGFGNGWLFSLSFSLAAPPDVDFWCRSLCFLLLFLFFCGGGFGVQLWWFWCPTVVVLVWDSGGVGGWVGIVVEFSSFLSFLSVYWWLMDFFLWWRIVPMSGGGGLCSVWWWVCHWLCLCM